MSSDWTTHDPDNCENRTLKEIYIPKSIDTIRRHRMPVTLKRKMSELELKMSELELEEIYLPGTEMIRRHRMPVTLELELTQELECIMMLEIPMMMPEMSVSNNYERPPLPPLPKRTVLGILHEQVTCEIPIRFNGVCNPEICTCTQDHLKIGPRVPLITGPKWWKIQFSNTDVSTSRYRGLVDTNGDEAENRFLVLEKMGVKNARKKVAQIWSDDEKIKVLTKRIENRKHQMEGLGVSMSSDWNISVMVPKMSQEINNPTNKVFSQPFFLEKYRYKLRLQVSMDGSGGSLSVFVHIMKGDYDSILDWPFMHKIAIKVKNQKGGEDSVQIVQPESTTIKKPEADQNITFGSRNFPTYSELVTGGFVRDDSISIECEVLWN